MNLCAVFDLWSSIIFQDFDNAGVFDAERLLEQRHNDEKQRLSRFLAEECQKELHYLDDAINEEKEKAAEELLANFNRVRHWGYRYQCGRLMTILIETLEIPLSVLETDDNIN